VLTVIAPRQNQVTPNNALKRKSISACRTIIAPTALLYCSPRKISENTSYLIRRCLSSVSSLPRNETRPAFYLAQNEFEISTYALFSCIRLSAKSLSKSIRLPKILL
jgi:hypothetical protein